MTYVLEVTAGELGDPVSLLVKVVSLYRLFHRSFSQRLTAISVLYRNTLIHSQLQLKLISNQRKIENLCWFKQQQTRVKFKAKIIKKNIGNIITQCFLIHLAHDYIRKINT